MTGIVNAVLVGTAVMAALLVGFAVGVAWCRSEGHRWLASKHRHPSAMPPDPSPTRKPEQP
jgi:hypothetical protein